MIGANRGISFCWIRLRHQGVTDGSAVRSSFCFAEGIHVDTKDRLRRCFLGWLFGAALVRRRESTKVLSFGTLAFFALFESFFTFLWALFGWFFLGFFLELFAFFGWFGTENTKADSFVFFLGCFLRRVNGPDTEMQACGKDGCKKPSQPRVAMK